MEKYTYKLTTLSSLIVSPRSNKAFYEVLGEFSLLQIKEDSIDLTNSDVKVIYPFYQYGEYTKYAPASASYYLPGSSVKGALASNETAPGSLMADDIPIPNDNIVLRHLFKAQYLLDEENACFDLFFNNVGIEMLKANTELEGEFYLHNIEAAKKLLKMASQSTNVKINQMIAYIGELKTMHYSQDLIQILDNLYEDLNSLLTNNGYMILIGGYKGLLHAMELKNSPSETSGAIFLDPEVMLPHGLVKIELVENRIENTK